MIYCPNCGVANREGSKFCNECGQALGLAPGIRCPMCSVMNPEENVLCSSCGARLVPLAAPEEAEEEEEPAPVRGLSLPIKPAVEEEEIEAEIPDWLRELREAAPVE
ncbi:MAG: zinc-ribbon domain-containing protein, partial [Anaerolineae bacterium]